MRFRPLLLAICCEQQCYTLSSATKCRLKFSPILTEVIDGYRIVPRLENRSVWQEAVLAGGPQRTLEDWHLELVRRQGGLEPGASPGGAFFSHELVPLDPRQA